MKHLSFILSAYLTVSAGHCADIAPNAPKDNPVDANAEEVKKLVEAIKPYVEQARKTYPEAKKRYLAGLPAKHVFFVTTQLKDADGKVEQVFIAVSGIKDGKITGRIQSDIIGVKGFKNGDAYTFPESDLVDWLISRPDGSEEGNIVGKFLDEYQTKEKKAAGDSAKVPVRNAEEEK